MFAKKDVKLGPAFPFIENKDGKISLAYDSFNIVMDGDYATATFIQDGVEIYSYTLKANYGDLVSFTGMKGKIDIQIR